MTFDEAFARLIGHEGGLSLDPRDRGNWTGGRRDVGELRGTKFGISAAAFPTLDIKSLTLDAARAIYREKYWGPACCDMLPEALRYPVFDLAVNSGPGRAARLLQRAVGAEEDGSIGPQTLMSVHNMPVDRILRRLDAHRLLLMAGDPTWPAHGRGWVIRVATNALEAS